MRVQDATPTKLKLKDYDKDGVKDLAAFQSPRALGLAGGDAAIRVSAAEERHPDQRCGGGTGEVAERARRRGRSGSMRSVPMNVASIS